MQVERPRLRRELQSVEREAEHEQPERHSGKRLRL